MNVRIRIASLKRWSVVLVGVGLLVSSVGAAVAAGSSLFVQPIAIAVLVVVYSGVVAVGLWLVRSGISPASAAIVTTRVVGSVLGIAILVTGSITLLLDDVGLGDVVGAAAYFSTVGALMGLAIGYVDARRRSHASVARSARAAIEQSTDAVAIVDPDGTFSMVNDAFVELHGFDSRDDVLGEDWHIRYPDEEMEHVETTILPELAETGSWRGETVGQRVDGERFTQELSLTMLDDGQVVAIVRDVSDRKERDREIERLALEGTGTGIWEWRFATDDVVWNESLELLLGLEPGEFDGTFEAFTEFVHPDDVPAMKAAVEQALENGEMFQTEIRMEKTDGSILWVETRGRVIGTGEDRRMVGIVSDVTDRRERISELEETTSRLHLALGGASPAIWEWYVETGEVVWNESMERTLGYAPGEFDGDFDEFVELIHPEDRESVFEAVEDARGKDSISSVEIRVADTDGEYRWLDLRGKFVEKDGEERLIGLARDVTEREEYRHELERRREMIERLHDATRTAIDAHDVDAVCETAVEAAVELLDAPLVGIWIADDADERLEPVAESDAARKEFGEPPTYTAADESRSWEAYESGEVLVLDDPSTIDGVANPDTTVQHEIVLPIGDLGVMNVATTQDRLFDDVDIYGARVLASNLIAVIDRARREDELRQQTDQLEFFSSILRHDVLNGMTVIRSRAELLAEETSGAQQEYADTIVKWCGNVTDVTGRVQRVIEALTASKESARLEPVDLSSSVDEQIERLRTTHTEATFESDVPEEVHVQADELLSDVLGNLLTNAIEHNEGDVTVRTTVDVEDDRVTLRVADDGTGVPDDRKEAIFRRGETGHAKEIGSGFGLFFVDTMIDRYGADVRVIDNEAGGATFVVEFSRASASATGGAAVDEPAHGADSS